MPSRPDAIVEPSVGVCPEPARWYASSAAVFERDDLGLRPAVDGPLRRVSLDQVLCDDAVLLRYLHSRLVAQGSPKPAAATYLAGWFAGSVARLVGLGLVTADAAVVLTSSEVSFELAGGGWPERTAPGRLGAVVAEGHPWQGHDRVTTLQPGVDVGSIAVRGLCELVSPLISVCRSLANVRLSALWEEVADGLGGVLAHQIHTPVSPAAVAVLEQALATAGAPWRNVPRLGFAASPELRAVHVVQRGGCCLAFTEPMVSASAVDSVPSEDGGPTSDGEALLQAYHARFVESPGAKRYCSTCRFRDPVDVDVRQVFWQERRADPALDRLPRPSAG